MIRITAFAGALLCLFATPLSAAGLHPDCNVTMPCTPVASVKPTSSREARRLARGQQLYRAMPFGMPVKRRGMLISSSSFEVAKINTGLVAPLQVKLASIQSACPGTAAISGVRHTYVAGTRRISLHASGKAVDVRGPYGCILSELRGWPGGHSIDPWRVKHIHISYDAEGGREMGLAFRHGGHRHRYAHRHHRRYASAGR